MKLRTFTAFSAMILLGSACASPDRKPSSAEPASTARMSKTQLAREAVEQLTALFQKHVVELDRPLLTFHYSENDSSRRRFNSLDDIQKWTERRPEIFFKPYSGDVEMVGPGYYVAIDPAATRPFGGDSPELTVVTIRKGSRLLDASYALNASEKQTLDKLMDKLECYGMGGYGRASIAGIISGFRNNGPTVDICAKALIQPLKKLGIQGFLYSYRASNLPTCRLRYQSLNIIEPSALQVEAFYSDDQKLERTKATRFIGRAYHDADSDFEYQLNRGATEEKPPRMLPTNIATDEKGYVAWRDANLLGCGPRWALEAPFSADGYVTKATLNEDQTLLLQMKEAYAKKMNGGTYNVRSLNAILQLVYETARLKRPDLKFAAWYASYNTLLGYSFDYHDGRGEEDLQEAVRNLGETAPAILIWSLDSDRILSEVGRSGDISADRVAAHLQTLGFGVRTAQILAFILTIGKGLAPAGVDAATFTNTLKTCLATYNDPSLSAEAVGAGPCGPHSDE